ncbi:uncharacterized protein E0L32_007428 [Thyridium curvatum]|uniref:Uncharacterized protein n=1 Tax=Thyridium curvatum TaxID=1093900 RepID=A0A507B5M5_9PEZI|nr:uncharacterized protein E0L32_007428 [Thyridium curvatum]TPX11930.1 hypothetical protein E0L32_007428 [Thyridium curvatum]
MKFSSAILAIAVLFSTSEACKCGTNMDATRACCRDNGGSPTDSDCPASDISENLSGFASCCRYFGARSDCRCPIGCARLETDAHRKAFGLKPLSDPELIDFVNSYDL